MKNIKRWLCIAAAFCLLLAAAPFAYAGDAKEEADLAARFSDKSWNEVVDEFLEEHYAEADRVALGYYNTVTGEAYYHNPDEYFIAASMYKVPLNMLFLEKIAAGEMDWTTDVMGYRYEYLLKTTIVESNNEMAELLWKKYGAGQYYPYRYYREAIAPYMGEDAEKVDPTYYKNNLFTARQIIQCLHLLYDNPERFPRLLDTMKQAEPKRFFNNHEQRVEIAHKYGYVEEDGWSYVNDCGVCYTEDPIIIVAFTKSVYKSAVFLADYCTLMIDYTEYHTALRHEQELEEARREAIQALNATPAPTEASGSEPATLSRQTTAESSAPTAASEAAIIKRAESKLPWAGILIVGCALLALIPLLRAGSEGQLKTGWALGALFAAALAMLLATGGQKLAPAVSAPAAAEGDPQQAVTAFMDAICAKQYDKAYDLLYDYASLGLESQSDSEAGRMMHEALCDSYSYILHGDCQIDKITARQQLVLDVLDLTALQEDLKQGVEQRIEAMSKERPSSELVDDNGDYLPEITNEAYLQTLQSLLSNKDRYRTSVGVELELYYTPDGWRIVTNQPLLKALSGRTNYTRGGESA